MGRNGEGMAAWRVCPVKSRTGLTVRCARSPKRSQVGIGGGELGELGIERNRTIHPRPGGRQITALAGVAPEIELNGRFSRMVSLGVMKDFFRGFERFGPARGVGPADPQCRFTRRVAHEFTREIADLVPFFLLMQNREPHRERLGPLRIRFRQLSKLRGGLGNHAEREVTLSVSDSALREHQGEQR